MRGNKVYGPDTCCFVPREINNFFTHKQKTNTTGFTGVYIEPTSGKYRVSGKFIGVKFLSKRLDTLEEAAELYLIKKTEAAKIIAGKYFSCGMISKEVHDAITKADFSI